MRASRLIRAGTAALVLLGFGAGAAGAAPPGPRLATVELIETKASLRFEDESSPDMALATVDPSTGRERRFLRGRMDAPGRVVPFPFVAPVWSSDGALIAFGGYDGRTERDMIYVVSADGAGLRAIPGTGSASHPVLSPDGRTLAFSRLRYRTHIDPDFFKDPAKGGFRVYSSTTAWLVDLAGGKPRRLTPWENDLHNTPTSFSPDGTNLLLTREDGNRDSPRVMRMSLADGKVQEVLGRAKEAVYSPDGTLIAFTGYLHPDLVEAEENHGYLAEELYVANADGSGTKRLSRSKGVLETAPSWDPSGQRLAYVQARGDRSWLAGLANLFSIGNALMQVNADGSCREKIASLPKVAFYGAAWQPGSGREAAPLSC